MTTLVVTHHHAAGIAREAAHRFRGNASAAFESRLAGLIGIGQRGGVDVHHDLVAPARRAGIELVMKCRLREQGERIRPLLSHGRSID